MPLNQTNKKSRKPRRRVPISSIHKKRTKKKVDQQLVDEMNKQYCNWVISGQTSMKDFIKLGEIATKLKKEVKHGNLTKIVRDELGLDLRLVQRAIKLFSSFSFSDYPGLYYAPRTHLECIVRNAGKQNTMAYLEADHIDLKFDPNNQDELEIFLKSIKRLAYQKSNTSTKKRPNSNVNNEPENQNDEEYAEDDQKEKSTNKLSSNRNVQINPKEIFDWVKEYRVKISNRKQLLTEKQILELNKVINAMSDLIRDFKPQD